MEFLPLQRLWTRGPTHPGFASSRFRCDSRVFHPPVALRPPRPSGPFRPVTLLGFPLRSLSLPRSRDASRRPLPSCRCSLRFRPRPEGHGRPHRDLGFTALLPAEVRHGRTGFSRPSARCSLEVRRSRAFRTRVAPCFQGTPLTGLAIDRLRDRVAGLSGSRSASQCSAPPTRDPKVARREHRSPSAVLTPRLLIRELRVARLLAHADGAGNLAVPRAPVFGARASSPGGPAEGVSVSSPGRHPTLAKEYIKKSGEVSSPCALRSYANHVTISQPVYSARVERSEMSRGPRSSR